MVRNRIISRRTALKLTAGGTLGLLAGCAINPVTGQQQLMLISPQQEIDMDHQNSPHQFSADYGAVQNKTVNSYISEVGSSLAATSHRPDMPYTFRCVNAVYVNAYAFPGGSIACTRGILLTLDNEAELAALLGHEIGHVCARHTASRMSSSMAIQGVIAIGTGVVATQNRDLIPLAAGLGGIGAGLLLASYSRSDERQADSLGMEYMDNAGYDPEGMVGLMEELNRLNESQPSFVQQMFASHPMSSERLATAIEKRDTTYSDRRGKLLHERYMDNIAPVLKIKPAIEEMQKGEAQMRRKAFTEAEKHFSRALSIAPGDYAGLLLMSKCMMAMGKNNEGLAYARKAEEKNPEEAQALHMLGMLNLKTGRVEQALNNFTAYEKVLPGNPMTNFYTGFSYEAIGNKAMAAQQYSLFLRASGQGDYAKHAYSRLLSWGYVRQ
ncbi:M48 family metalloprotease [Maridesulfovibrio sp.]|uniref:M48 family metalloprotease n=1 Tax=Maridesulfovibrio sp. TaxID=2795000 RepID=UPI002A18A935|nr:M48 family metalloprotease [Maridesulfovibrio sp.]